MKRHTLARNGFTAELSKHTHTSFYFVDFEAVCILYSERRITGGGDIHILPGVLNVLQAHSTAQFFCLFLCNYLGRVKTTVPGKHGTNTGARQEKDGQTREKHGNAELTNSIFVLALCDDSCSQIISPSVHLSRDLPYHIAERLLRNSSATALAEIFKRFLPRLQRRSFHGHHFSLSSSREKLSHFIPFTLEKGSDRQICTPLGANRRNGSRSSSSHRLAPGRLKL